MSESVSQRYGSAHDPMCLEPLSLEEREIFIATVEPVYCDVCKSVAKARADERERIMEELAQKKDWSRDA